jgi:hypothetical protein
MLLPIGLDILGPGGGQRRVRLREDRLVDMDRGLPSEAAAVLTISTDDWQQLSRLSRREAVNQLSANLEATNGLAVEPLANGLHKALFSQAPKTREEPACEAS